MTIVLNEGGNNEYQIPRSDRSHRREGPTYIPRQNNEVEDETQEMEREFSGEERGERGREEEEDVEEDSAGEERGARGEEEEEEEREDFSREDRGEMSREEDVESGVDEGVSEVAVSQRSLSRIFEEIANQNEISNYWLQRSNRRRGIEKK